MSWLYTVQCNVTILQISQLKSIRPEQSPKIVFSQQLLGLLVKNLRIRLLDIAARNWLMEFIIIKTRWCYQFFHVVHSDFHTLKHVSARAAESHSSIYGERVSDFCSCCWELTIVIRGSLQRPSLQLREVFNGFDDLFHEAGSTSYLCLSVFSYVRPVFRFNVSV